MWLEANRLFFNAIIDTINEHDEQIRQKAVEDFKEVLRRSCLRRNKDENEEESEVESEDESEVESEVKSEVESKVVVETVTKTILKS